MIMKKYPCYKIELDLVIYYKNVIVQENKDCSWSFSRFRDFVIKDLFLFKLVLAGDVI